MCVQRGGVQSLRRPFPHKPATSLCKKPKEAYVYDSSSTVEGI